MALTDSLISYWKCDEVSGNLLDAHGTNDLTDNNTVGTATGLINSGRDFERDTAESFSKADNASLSVGDIDFTWAFWVKQESLNNNFITKITSWPNSSEYAIYTFGGQVQFLVGNGSTFGQPTGVTLNDTGVWHYVVCWHDSVGNTLNIQVDNGTVSSTSYSGGGLDGTANLVFGSNGSTGASDMDGIMDEIGFWKRVLTSQERTDLYNGGSGLSYDSFGGSTARPRLIGGRLVNRGLTLGGLVS